MPTNRTRRSRQVSTLTDDEREWLYADDTDNFLFFHDEKEMLNLWKSYCDEVLTFWTQNKPCTRPLRWWDYEAPRWNDPFEGWFIHGTMPEPRQRIGGIGTPSYEVLRLCPSFFKGVSRSWITEVDIKHHTDSFKGKNVFPIDRNDPPTFESEAAYLQRHDLLTPQEKKYLASHRKLLEPEIVAFDD